MQKLAASMESFKTQGKDNNESNPDDLAAYEAFLATQSNTTEEDYQKVKSTYITPSKCFSHVDITANIFPTGFEMSTAPCLGDQEIAKIILKKNDHGEKALLTRRLLKRSSMQSSPRSILARFLAPSLALMRVVMMLLAMPYPPKPSSMPSAVMMFNMICCQFSKSLKSLMGYQFFTLFLLL
jgi:hypothetical protein